MEEVKNSTLAIIDILVTIKDDLAALREDTQDVKRELVTVREDTQDVKSELETAKEDTDSALTGLKEDTQCIKIDVESLRQNTDSALQDLKMDLNQDTSSTLMDLATLREDTQNVKMDLATLREDTNSRMQDLQEGLATLRQEGSQERAEVNATVSKIQETVEEDNLIMNSVRDASHKHQQFTTEQFSNISEEIRDIQQSFLGLASQCETSSPVTECDPLISVQYLPTSCSELATSSPSGYYWIYNYDVRVYCDFSVTSQQDPALSCEHIATHHPLTPSGYYWVRSSNDSAVIVYCYVTSQQDPAPSCQEIHPSAPSGHYWVESYNGSSVNVYCDNHLTSREDPSHSCQDIAETHLSAPSGYYWVRSSNGSAVSVYCDMARHCCGSTGGWMRVAYLNMTDTSQQCPEGFTLRSGPKRTCEMIDDDCTSILHRSHHIQYSKVCGRVRAYQNGQTIAFYRYDRGYGTTIDGNYVSGMSITHGESPRKHLWTFAAAADETRSNVFACPCTKTDSPYTRTVPPFIGNDYFCDTGSRERFEYGRFYPEDPLWDGEGCGPTSSCCQFNSPPWFCKELPQPTTDDVEVRVCTWSQQNRDTPFDFIELYIQ